MFLVIIRLVVHFISARKVGVDIIVLAIVWHFMRLDWPMLVLEVKVRLN